MSFSTTRTTTKLISSYTRIKPSSPPNTEIKSIWTTHTKCKWICMLTLKTSDFRPALKNKPIWTTHTKTGQLLSPHKTRLISTSQVNFDLHSKNDSIFHAPGHKNQHNFDPDSKSRRFRPPQQTKSVLIPTLKASQLRPPILKSLLFRPPTQQPSQFRCQH